MNSEKLKNIQVDKSNMGDIEIENESYLEDENIEYDIVYSVNDVLKTLFLQFINIWIYI